MPHHRVRLMVNYLVVGAAVAVVELAAAVVVAVAVVVAAAVVELAVLAVALRLRRNNSLV